MSRGTTEIWYKCVAPYTRYEVSNMGRVRNHKGEIMAQWPSKWGYMRISLFNKGKSKMLYVHRLVAFAFCRGYCSGMEVDHINGIRNDNRAANLRWVTSYENKQNLTEVTGTPILCFKDGRTSPVAIYRSCHELQKVEGGLPSAHLKKSMTFHGMKLKAISAEEYKSMKTLIERGYTLKSAWVETFTRLPL